MYGGDCMCDTGEDRVASQEEVETMSDYSVFEYQLKPTYDFEQEILSHREDVEVLEPMSLRETIKDSILKMALLYNG